MSAVIDPANHLEGCYCERCAAVMRAQRIQRERSRYQHQPLAEVVSITKKPPRIRITPQPRKPRQQAGRIIEYIVCPKCHKNVYKKKDGTPGAHGTGDCRRTTPPAKRGPREKQKCSICRKQITVRLDGRLRAHRDRSSNCCPGGVDGSPLISAKALKSFHEWLMGTGKKEA